MSNDDYRKLREAIERRALRPAREQFDEMIRRGAVDQEGNVTIRRPEVTENPVPDRDNEEAINRPDH